MLIRISLIFAILLGLAAGAWNYFKVKEQVDLLQKDRLVQRQGWADEKAVLAKTRGTLTTTSNNLVTAQRNLASTRTELAQATSQITSLTGTIGGLRQNLQKATEERDVARGDLEAFAQLKMTPKEIIEMRDRSKALVEENQARTDENNLLFRKNQQLEADLKKIRDPEGTVVYLPPNLSGKVEVADPKWGFVVLNVGLENGVLSAGEFLVHRNGRLVAKVIVSRIEKNRCVANIMPGPWKTSDIFEGDLVTPAHPAES